MSHGEDDEDDYGGDWSYEESLLEVPDEFTEEDYERVIASEFGHGGESGLQRRVIMVIIGLIVFGIMLLAVLT